VLYALHGGELKPAPLFIFPTRTMSRISTKEKEFWRDSFARRIDEQIRLLRNTHAEDIRRLDERAKASAIRSLGIGPLLAARRRAEDAVAAIDRDSNVKIAKIQDEASAKKAILQSHASLATRRAIAKIRNVPLDDVAANPSYESRVIDEQIGVRQRAELDRLMRKHPIGRKLQRLSCQKDQLLDAIWLSTSSEEMARLWRKLMNLLGLSSSELEKEVARLQ
jgi:hypothetical protein